MSVPCRVAVFLLTVFLMSGREAHAQTPGAPGPADGWVVAASLGGWDRVPTRSGDGHRYGTALDASIQRSLGPARGGAPAIRVQVGTGSGDGVREPGFNYTRLLIGLVRNVTSASQAPFTVYASGGGGAYAVRSPRGRDTKPSVYGAIGLDVALGSTPTSLGAEVQVQSIGGRLYGTTSLGVRLHVP